MRKSVVLLAAVFFVVADLFADLEWRRVGMADTVVTSIIKINPSLETGDKYILGTKGEGVYMMVEGEIRKLSSSEDLEESLSGMDTADVSALAYMDENIFAATKNGVWRYPLGDFATEDGITLDELIAGSAWIQCRLPDGEYADIEKLLTGKTNYVFTCSGNRVYRGNLSTTEEGSEEQEMEWDTLPVTGPLPEGSKNPTFSTLAVFQNDYIYAGSIGNLTTLSWSGIIVSEDLGESWRIWDEDITGVSELSVFKDSYQSENPTYITAVDPITSGDTNTVFMKIGESGEWREQETLRNKSANSFYVTNTSESDMANLHAATDTGAYVYAQISIPEEDPWQLMEDSPEMVNALSANIEHDSDYDSLYAGSDKGLYLYTEFDDTTGIEEDAGVSRNRDILNRVDIIAKGSGISVSNLPPGKMRSIRLYDIKGSLIAEEKQVSVNTQRVVLKKDLNPGMYVLDIKAGKQSMRTKISLTE